MFFSKNSATLGATAFRIDWARVLNLYIPNLCAVFNVFKRYLFVLCQRAITTRTRCAKPQGAQPFITDIVKRLRQDFSNVKGKFTLLPFNLGLRSRPPGLREYIQTMQYGQYAPFVRCFKEGNQFPNYIT